MFSERIDKTTFQIVHSAKDWEATLSFWIDKSPLERLKAIEYLRQQFIKANKLPTQLDKTVFAIHLGK